MLNTFLQAIREKRLLSIHFIAKENSLLKNRRCVPFDFGPSRKYRDDIDRFHFLDLNSPNGSHPLALETNQIISIRLLNENFEPAEYITWPPNWIIDRDWGVYS